jgi:hypothetical protein
MIMSTQFSCRSAAIAAAAVTAALLAFAPALAGSISSTAGPDPILSGAPADPCAASAGADYVAGVDANGNAVAPADASSPDLLGSNRVLVTVPLKKHARGAGEATVAVDLAKLAPPSCTPPAPRRR